MKKLIVLYILFVLVTTSTVLASSSMNVETTIDESVHVTFEFADIETQLYSEIKTEGFNVSTIPNALEGRFEQQGLTNARAIYDLNQEIFDDDTQSVHVKFFLAGSDIISYTLDKNDMTRTFHVRAEWRTFEISFTQNFSVNLEEHFGVPLTEWRQANHTFEKSVDEDPIEMSFRFILPEEAFDIQAEKDTIIFKVPLVFEDNLLNSPFLILGAIIIANILIAVYRKARK
jgi:hypothetical protein